MKDSRINFSRILLALACVTFISCSRTTVYIVRHAEKDTEQINNPPLTAAGLERARDLAKLLKDEHISVVYSTNFTRTISTAQPTADEHQVVVTLYDSIPQLMNLIAFHNKKDVLIAGHSNTILDIAKALGITPVKQEIADSDYDNLLIVSKHKFLFWKKTALEETTYGMPTLP
ncbi:MAG: phosphoglycerate mutase family protein [Chitinophagales bacterium]